LHPPFVEPGVDVIHQLLQAIGVKDSAFASSAYNKLATSVCPMQMSHLYRCLASTLQASGFVTPSAACAYNNKGWSALIRALTQYSTFCSYIAQYCVLQAFNVLQVRDRSMTPTTTASCQNSKINPEAGQRYQACAAVST
jgi:hypothetical protein